MKRVFYVGIMIIFLLVVIGCQSKSSNETEKNNADEMGEKEVTLRFSWWGSEDRHTATLDAIDLYMEKNPHVKIEGEYSGFDGYYQKLVTQFTGGTAPDLTPLSMDWIEDLVVNGDLVVDLHDYSELINISAFDSEFLQKYAEFDDKLAGLPMGVNGAIIVYNEEFFEKFNIPKDTVWDWDTLLEIGKRVNQEDPDSYLLEGVEYRLFLQGYTNQQTGNSWINDDGTIGFDKEALTNTLTYYKELIDNGVMQPLSESTLYSDIVENQAWLNGKIGMTFTLASVISRLQSSISSVGVATFPIPDDAKTTGVLVNPSTILAINKESENIDEAAKFLSWLLTDEEAGLILSDVRSVPAVKSISDKLVEAEKVDPVVAEAVDLAMSSAGDPVYGLSTNQELAQLSGDFMEQVGYGQMSPEEAAENIIKRTNEVLSELEQ